MDKCPFCGASDDMGLFTDEVSYWDCGSPQEEDWRSDKCYERQIAALQEKLEITETWRSDNLRQLKGTLNLKYELEKEITALKELYTPCHSRMIDLQDAYIKMRQEIAALKSDLALWKDFWDNMRTADKVIYESICTHTKRLKERGLI